MKIPEITFALMKYKRSEFNISDWMAEWKKFDDVLMKPAEEYIANRSDNRVFNPDLQPDGEFIFLLTPTSESVIDTIDISKLTTDD